MISYLELSSYGFLFFIIKINIFLRFVEASLYTVVGDYSNIMKTSFDFKFDLYLAFKKHSYTQKHGNNEELSI